ncbi:uncharacterized protein MELLADRAFT_56002 [Melampsora larici-populina 98AG31]|uniref:Uncharacterized protein n=1 Tax=Melampsora larici-populina (strain 98AG31 / pathotype 3-4-7) TaxID=747676 RepID=F4RKJ4_MELLP|nr:uncharacterized protein MELLADRAFT_56002 [Melampsora larici-populina 98AG31]EGG07104.1 hypothetical protein MELLADRAFT_56002 [Melampsora larici-populina 98AG31]
MALSMNINPNTLSKSKQSFYKQTAKIESYQDQRLELKLKEKEVLILRFKVKTISRS